MGLLGFLGGGKKKSNLTSKDIGNQLEERVATLYRRLGYFGVRRSLIVKDHFGNISEIDVKAGILFKRYVECKHYSATHPVPFSDVAKFKSVLELNSIPIEKGVFITTSTFTPRCATVGIRCIDGVQLARMERWSYVVRTMNRSLQGLAVSAVAVAAGYIYYNPIQLEKIKTWNDINREYRKAEKILTAWYRRLKREASDLLKPRE